MPPHYPELDPPQHASFPLPPHELADLRDGLWRALGERIASDPLHLLGLLLLLGLAAHFWYAVHRGRRAAPAPSGRTGRLAGLHASLVRSPHLWLLSWLLPLIALAWAVHGPEQTSRFFLFDGRFRYLWHLGVVALVSLSRPGQLAVEWLLHKVAKRLGPTPRTWWLVLVFGGSLMAALASVVGVVPVVRRLLRLHVLETRGRRVRRVSEAVLFTNLSLAAGLGVGAGNAVPAGGWDLPSLWNWKVLTAISILSAVGLALLWRPLRLGSRLPPEDPGSEIGQLPGGLAFLAGLLLVGLPFLVDHPGWLVSLPLGYAVVLRTLGIERSFAGFRAALPLLGLALLWVPLGRIQHWWTSAVLESGPAFADVAFAGALASVFGSTAGHALVPSVQEIHAQIGVLAFGGVGVAAVATWLGRSSLAGDGGRGVPAWQRLLLDPLAAGVVAAAVLLLLP